MSPQVSVIIPLYNKEREISRSIQSVLNQTFENFELIIVDDGSTDNSLDVVRAFSDERIRVLQQSNSGVASARNRGISEAMADLVAFLDADDEWDHNFLATMVELRTDFPQAKVYGTRYWIKSDDGIERKNILNHVSKDFKRGIIENYFLVASTSDPPLTASSIVIDKQAILRIGGFPEGIGSGEDLLTWARLAVHCSIAYSMKALAFFWTPTQIGERNNRFDYAGDPVGDALLELREQIDERRKKDFSRYLALWYRMNAITYLRLGKRKLALRHAILSIKYGGLSSRIVLLSLLAFVPANADRVIYRMKLFIEKKRRNHVRNSGNN